jgi:hypothetical protein
MLILAVRWAILTGSRQESYSARGFNDALVGQAYRVVVARGREGGRIRASALVVLERLIGFASYALIFLVAFAIETRDTTNAVMNSAAGGFAAILLCISAFIVGARWMKWEAIWAPQWPLFQGLREAAHHFATLSGWRLLSAHGLTLVALSASLPMRAALACGQTSLSCLQPSPNARGSSQYRSRALACGKQRSPRLPASSAVQAHLHLLHLRLSMLSIPS